MLKKRLIFTLLYGDGQFMLSRNFRLQKVGDFSWLQLNYNFSKISYSIDELIVLDVNRKQRNIDEFCDVLKKVARGCFVPIAAGGGVRSVADARKLLRAGADKVVVNSALYQSPNLISNLANEFGEQCIVAAMDIKTGVNGLQEVWSENGSHHVEGGASNWIKRVMASKVGELYLNSIDRDGTGQGFDFTLLDLLQTNCSKGVILAGGVGNWTHLAQGLADLRVDAVATAHLFNFVGDGLKKARNSLILNEFDLPSWSPMVFEDKQRNLSCD